MLVKPETSTTIFNTAASIENLLPKRHFWQFLCANVEVPIQYLVNIGK